MNNDDKHKLSELIHLSEELSLLRNEMQSINLHMKKIEKRIEFAYPEYKGINKYKIINSKNAYNNRELLEIFEILRDVTKTEGDVGFSLKIKEYASETVIALALELGVPGSKKMGIKKAILGIKGRVQESIMLS
jgi:hypothetical protein